MSRTKRSTLYLAPDQAVLRLSDDRSVIRLLVEGVTVTQLTGADRDLFYAIIDLMRAYDERRKSQQEVVPMK